MSVRVTIQHRNGVVHDLDYAEGTSVEVYGGAIRVLKRGGQCVAIVPIGRVISAEVKQP